MTWYGPAAAKTLSPSGSAGMFGGTAQKYGSVRRAGKSGAGCVSRIVSVRPRATTPRAEGARPASTSAAPTMSRVCIAPGECIPGSSVRLIARAKASARTGLPSLKRKPVRSVNLNVRESRETCGWVTATSGTILKPAGGGRSGYVRSRAQKVSISAQPTGEKESAGST